jgi:glutamine amidotransferase
MIVIVDYGMGNLRSVAKAIEYLGYEAMISDKVSDLGKADKLILPGVGAFGSAMENIKKLGLENILIEKVINQKTPFLGICLGLQLLGDFGYEHGQHRGLGWIKGIVLKLDVESTGLKIPHVGWNSVSIVKDSALFNGIKDNSDFYFVHSYQLIVSNKDDLAASTEYGGEITAVIHHNNIFATQFHPEKSQENGLKLLDNFINWQPDYA